MNIFHGWVVPEGFVSDGCTCAPDELFGVDLRPACEWHDWARRHLVHYGVMTVQEADKLFKAYLIRLGLPRWCAHLYWLGVKIGRPWFSRTYPVPRPEWLRYVRKPGRAF